MGNEVFVIKGEEDTPFVSLQKNNDLNSIILKGVSMPENVLDFYNPLSEKIFSFFDGNFANINLEISLEYMNSMSNKQLLKLVRNIAVKDTNLKIVWKYNSNDQLIKMKGEEIKSIFPQLNMTLSEITV